MQAGSMYLKKEHHIIILEDQESEDELRASLHASLSNQEESSGIMWRPVQQGPGEWSKTTSFTVGVT